MKRLSSSANPLFRQLLALQQSARERREADLAVIEGLHLVGAFAARHGEPLHLFLRESSRAESNSELASIIAACGVEPVLLSDRLFGQASQVQSGPGPIAIVRTPRPQLPQRLRDDLVYLDRIQDPGNVGSIIRSAAAAGVRQVLASPASASCWSPKVLRAAMGGHFHLHIHEGVTVDELLSRLDCQAAAMALDAKEDLFAADLRAPMAWMFGNEGEGLADALRDAPRIRKLTIPQTDAVESLSVGVAAAICLFEQRRQRQMRPASAP